MCSSSPNHANYLTTTTTTTTYKEDGFSVQRRSMVGWLCSISAVNLLPFSANGAGLPPEDKPKLCDEACEKDLENVW